MLYSFAFVVEYGYLYDLFALRLYTQFKSCGGGVGGKFGFYFICFFSVTEIFFVIASSPFAKQTILIGIDLLDPAPQKFFAFTATLPAMLPKFMLTDVEVVLKMLAADVVTPSEI